MRIKTILDNASRTNQYEPKQVATVASQYSYQELADIYNQTRIDYIVPMPMNARRMKEYVESYDIDLSASVVSFYDDVATGIGMLGIRDNRAWITRLGVIPNSRGKKNGSFLMDMLFHQARLNRADKIQLEVISGNEPAHNLFNKYKFQEKRELSVIRRPPGPPQFDNPLPDATIANLTADEITECLNKRSSDASWIEETPSILKTGQLFGYRLTVSPQEHGWIIFHSSAFQMGHFVLEVTPQSYDNIVLALLYIVHRRHSIKDTKIENVPVKHRLLTLFQQVGYIESFRRIEMECSL